MKNKIMLLKTGVIYMQLTQDKSTLLDESDYSKVKDYRWCTLKIKNLYYAATTINKKPKLMHRHIIGLIPAKMVIDHKDTNGLNNCRYNLRICTQRQNLWNQRPFLNSSSSGTKGVCWDKSHSSWKAQINVDGVVHHLGRYTTRASASKAYQNAANRYFGDFVRFSEDKPSGSFI